MQKVFYNQNPSFGYQWMMVMSTQLIGFSLGGICKRFLVTPPSMIWPANLVAATLFNTLHGRQTAGSEARGGISRERFFLVSTQPLLSVPSNRALTTYLFSMCSASTSSGVRVVSLI